MNTAITFPRAAPALKLARGSADKRATTAAEERRRLQEDQDALREQELNLREYEARLRLLQAEIEAGRGASVPPVGAAGKSSRAPGGDHVALQAGWDKLYRARELLEAEQVHLRDDRIAVRDQELSLKKQLAALQEREARLTEREQLVTEASAQPVAGEHTLSAMTLLTRVPFNMARAVFSAKK